MQKLQRENRIYYYKNPALHGFFISLFLREGSVYESAENLGITHFLEHALVRNVNNLRSGELYRELDRLGIEFGASTYFFVQVSLNRKIVYEEKDCITT